MIKPLATFLVGFTAFLALGLAVNHAVHGIYCWGFKNGGTTSRTIYDLQILCALGGSVWLLFGSIGRTRPVRPLWLLAIGVFLGLSYLAFDKYGYRAHTSIEDQGPENLVAYFAVAATTCLIGWYPIERREVDDAGAGDASPASAVDVDRPPTDNPYESPHSTA